MSAGVVAEIWAVATSGKGGRGDEKEKSEAGKRGKKGKRGASGLGFATCKEQGEWAELCFMARARQIGLAVLKPYRDSPQYDVGIEHKGAAGAGAGEVDDVHTGADVHLQHGGTGRKTVQAGDAGFLRGVPGAGEFVVHPAICGGEQEEERVAAVHSGESGAQV